MTLSRGRTAVVTGGARGIGLATEAMPQRAWDQKTAEVPLGRAGEPDEIASVCTFYASHMSSCMTGTVAEVTGGRLM
ncbi:SDR family oxidoreductase [Nocardiopsis ganjiahuensis]|uniref:SDR family oxidoreductase n=1 Tax=Nocardiopsis ganjiahuensis TaxID=239984 RepID=UPI000348B5A1|nr:SDR family oxidoreductase [Nocardiopsis ganjiahuensis]